MKLNIIFNLLYTRIIIIKILNNSKFFNFGTLSIPFFRLVAGSKRVSHDRRVGDPIAIRNVVRKRRRIPRKSASPPYRRSGRFDDLFIGFRGRVYA